MLQDAVIKSCHGVGITGGAFIFAQAPDTPTTIVGAFIFIAVSMSAVVGFVVKKLLEDAKVERKESNDQSKADRDQFFNAMASMEAREEKRMKAEDIRIDKLTKAFSELFERQAEQNRQDKAIDRADHNQQIARYQQMLTDSMTSDRRAVHDVKDVANQVILTQAAASLQEKK